MAWFASYDIIILIIIITVHYTKDLPTEVGPRNAPSANAEVQILETSEYVSTVLGNPCSRADLAKKAPIKSLAKTTFGIVVTLI
jgi:hypothetical protein